MIVIFVIVNAEFPISDRAAGQRMQRDTSMEVDDVCVSEGVCEVMRDVPSNGPHHAEPMETHVMEEEEEAAQDEGSGPVRGDTDFPAAVHSNANMGPEPPKPRFSYRLEGFNACHFGYLIFSAWF